MITFHADQVEDQGRDGILSAAEDDEAPML